MTTTEVYLIRCVLDTDEDVVRDIALLPGSDLNLVHKAILNAFDLQPGEMCSFFMSNEDWEQGEEISMMDFDPETGRNALESRVVSTCFPKIGDRMLYVYDFLKLWTFYLELVALPEPDMDKTYPRLIGKIGERPAEAPEKHMEAGEDPNNPFEDNDDFDALDESQWY